jgi:hypothetical protein|tara:strand:- start:3068 stop:3304 length:237 start_codon:yes stop_codon:yes gene_type:complete
MESVSTTLIINGSRSHIEALLAGISADDPDTFEAKIIENKNNYQLKILVSGENLATVRSTVDDLLACLGAIESTLNSL